MAQVMKSDQGVALPRPGWRDRAACAGTDPELWVVPNGHTTVPSHLAAVCLRCPVIADCAVDAIEHGDQGVIRAATVLVRKRETTRGKLGSLLSALGVQAG